MFNCKWLINGYFPVLATLFTCFPMYKMEAPWKPEYAPTENTTCSTDWIHCEWNNVDHKSVNLDLDSLDFKSNESTVY